MTTNVYFEDEEIENVETINENISLADQPLEAILNQDFSDKDLQQPPKRTTGKFPYPVEATLQLVRLESELSMAKVTQHVTKHGAAILQKKYGDARKLIRENKRKLLRSGDVFIDTNVLEGHLHPSDGRQIRKGPYIIWWVVGLLSELASDLHVQKMTLLNVVID